MAAAEILDILNQQVALLTGGRDRQGQSLITFPAKPKTFTYNRDDVRKVVQYLTSIPTLVALCRMCLSGWGLESHVTSLISVLLVVVCHMPKWVWLIEEPCDLPHYHTYTNISGTMSLYISVEILTL